MKKNVTMWMAALALMVSACGGSAGGGNEAGSTGSERPEAFDEMFAHVEEYYRVSAEQGRQAAEAMFWKEHRLGSLKFNVAVEDSLPPERPGAGVQGWQLQQRPVADGQREGDGRQRSRHCVPRVLSRRAACHGEVNLTERPQQIWR